MNEKPFSTAGQSVVVTVPARIACRAGGGRAPGIVRHN